MPSRKRYLSPEVLLSIAILIVVFLVLLALHWAPLQAVVGTSGVALLLGAILFLPQYLVRRDADASGEKITHVEFLKAKNDRRATLLQGFSAALLIATAYFTWQQLLTSRDGQVTERFTKAIEQLGSDNAAVRVGAVYALERIAKDSEKDRTTVAEIMSTYVKAHSQWAGFRKVPSGGKPLRGSSRQWRCPVNNEEAEVKSVLPMEIRAPDVHAALTVLRRQSPEDGFRLRLVLTDLSAAVLDDAHLSGADFRGSNLEWAHLQRTHLEKAALSFGNVYCEARLGWAFLQEAYLQDALLEGAHLEGARLQGARLQGAHLSWTDLRGADLTSANLTEADLTKALADSSTRWPQGFRPKDAGVYVLEPEANLCKAELAQRNLSGADLSGAHLQGADLSWTDLRGADLTNADLSEVDLREANLTGVNLSSVKLNKADLNGALVDSTTRWPPDFNLKTAGTRDAATNRLQTPD